MDVTIWPPDRPVRSTVTLPLSKSESNRALIIRALTAEPGPYAPLSDCDDTRAIETALTSARHDGATVNVGPAGTAMRFLTAYFASQPGISVTLDGDARMRQRPIGPLVEALRRCGASVDYLASPGFPPLRITGRRLTGGTVEVDASVSSQFISALMMIAPAMTCGIDITMRSRPVSRPYVAMTAAMMTRAGAHVNLSPQRISVAPGAYTPGHTTHPEGDWSAASYWFELAAMSPQSDITLHGLTADSLQGDSHVARLMAATGITAMHTGPRDITLHNNTGHRATQIDADLTDTPDLVPAVAVTCCMLGIAFRLTGLQSLRIKETDRLEALRSELGKLGISVSLPAPGVMEWQPAAHPTPIPRTPEPIHCHVDHRMAMAFAPAAIFHPGLTLLGAECVTKSYPRFWHDLRAAGFTINETA